MSDARKSRFVAGKDEIEFFDLAGEPKNLVSAKQQRQNDEARKQLEMFYKGEGKSK